MTALGGTDEGVSSFLKMLAKRPITVGGPILAIIGGATLATAAWMTLNANVTHSTERITQIEMRVSGLETKVQNVDDKATSNLDKVRSDLSIVKNDLSEVKGDVKGIDRNIQILVRQGASTPPRYTIPAEINPKQ